MGRTRFAHSPSSPFDLSVVFIPHASKTASSNWILGLYLKKYLYVEILKLNRNQQIQKFSDKENPRLCLQAKLTMRTNYYYLNMYTENHSYHHVCYQDEQNTFAILLSRFRPQIDISLSKLVQYRFRILTLTFFNWIIVVLCFQNHIRKLF